MIDVSIILVNWNTRQILCDCLASIYEQTQGLCFEVFVVDNASSDGSVKMIQQDFAQVRLIANSENKGFAAANNQAISIAKGNFILLLNSDTIILDNAIFKVWQFAQQRPSAGIVGCRVLNADQSLQSSCFMYPSVLNMFLLTTYLSKLFPRSAFFGRERMTWWDRSDVREVEVVTGCFMLVRRQVIEQIGLLDEEYYIYGEETDWCYRAHHAGWKLLFTPDAQIIHLGGASSKQAKPQMIMQLRGSLLYFMKKHASRASYAIACILVSLFFSVRTPYWFLRGVFIQSERIRSFITAKTYLSGALKALFGADALRQMSFMKGISK